MDIKLLDPALKEFSDLYITPIIRALIDGKYRLPLIQDEFSELIDDIYDRYPHGFEFVLSGVINQNDPDGRTPFAVLNKSKNQPTIGIFLPVVFAVYQQTDRNTFESFVVIGLMHGMIHLVLTDSENSEATAWAETCKSIIRLFVETYGEGINQDDWNFYSEWIRCGGDENSRSWQDFIAQIYN